MVYVFSWTTLVKCARVCSIILHIWAMGLKFSLRNGNGTILIRTSRRNIIAIWGRALSWLTWAVDGYLNREVEWALRTCISTENRYPRRHLTSIGSCPKRLSWRLMVGLGWSIDFRFLLNSLFHFRHTRIKIFTIESTRWANQHLVTNRHRYKK